jgi:hypothetical protein
VPTADLWCQATQTSYSDWIATISFACAVCYDGYLFRLAAEDELKQLGFKLDGEGMLDLISTTSRLARTIEHRLDAEVGTKDEVLTRRFNSAGIKLLLVAIAEEAEKIVEPLLNFEVAVK